IRDFHVTGVQTCALPILAVADEVLDPEALTIGFARRFAGYKRGALLLRDQDRLRHLLENTKTPIQFIFAGKAHPADNEGKELIRSEERRVGKEGTYRLSA